MYLCNWYVILWEKSADSVKFVKEVSPSLGDIIAWPLYFKLLHTFRNLENPVFLQVPMGLTLVDVPMEGSYQPALFWSTSAIQTTCKHKSTSVVWLQLNTDLIFQPRVLIIWKKTPINQCNLCKTVWFWFDYRLLLGNMVSYK